MICYAGRHQWVEVPIRDGPNGEYVRLRRGYYRFARDPGATPTARPIPLSTASSAGYSGDRLLIDCTHGYQCVRLSLSTG
jgi:hypothetical protein